MTFVLNALVNKLDQDPSKPKSRKTNTNSLKQTSERLKLFNTEILPTYKQRLARVQTALLRAGIDTKLNQTRSREGHR